jgi:hypothetical protein
MNKGELIKAVAAEAGLTQKEAGIAFDAFVTVVTKELKAGEKVTLPGFGTYEVRKELQELVLTQLQKLKLKLLHVKFQLSNLVRALKTSSNI